MTLSSKTTAIAAGLALWASGIGALAAPEVQARKSSGVDALGVPLVSFDSDLGFGVGAVGGAYFYSPGYAPYRHAIALQTYFTTLGIQNHYLRYDGPHLIGPLRVEARLEYHREKFAPFYGLGNDSAPGYLGTSDNRDYSFRRFSPSAWLRVRDKPLGDASPFEVYAGYQYTLTRVDLYEGSALAQQLPFGVQGGPTSVLLLGAMFDRRDSETDATRGTFAELGARIASRAFGSGYDYAGFTASVRGYAPLGPRVVIAGRATVDQIVGAAPFFELTDVGGTLYTEGIGGMTSVRGVPRERYAGQTKAFVNAEARIHVYQFQLIGEQTRVGVIALADAGRVWQPDALNGPWYAWHPGLGGGIRLARRAAVLRFDTAWAPELHRAGAYITFGHMF